MLHCNAHTHAHDGMADLAYLAFQNKVRELGGLELVLACMKIDDSSVRLPRFLRAISWTMVDSCTASSVRLGETMGATIKNHTPGARTARNGQYSQCGT